jgi:hypothetical protein
MSLVSKISRFARSPQGKKLTGQAQRWASDPKNKRKIQQLRSRYAGRR